MFRLYNRFTTKYRNTRKKSLDEKIDCLPQEGFADYDMNDLFDVGTIC